MKKTKGMLKIEGVFGKAQKLIDDLRSGVEMNRAKAGINSTKITELTGENEVLDTSCVRANSLAQKLEEFISVD